MPTIIGDVNKPVTMRVQQSGDWKQTGGPNKVNLRIEYDGKSASFTPSDYGLYKFECSSATAPFEVQVGPVTGGGGENPPPVEQPPVGEFPAGEQDANGILWLVARGKQTLVKQSRDQADDDRWSANVLGLGKGYEATMIAKSIGTSSGAHFASKLFEGNHSGSGAEDQRWYDLGIRENGDIQLQWEGPHPDNHSFSLPSSKLFMKNIGVKLEGNNIGLKWCVQKVNGQQNGSPQNGGVRVRMWVDKDPLDANGRPKNNWQLVLDFTDGQDGIQVIKPQTFSAPDNIDIEIRRSNTKTHQVYAGGQHVRALA